jgi:OmpA-OmpF porin, OOP family
MRNWMKPGTTMLLLYLVFLGCATHKSPPAEETKLPELPVTGYHQFGFESYQPIDTEGYVKKVDNFTIIFDPSASMTEVYEASYECIACHSDFQGADYAESHAVRYGGDMFAAKKVTYTENKAGEEDQREKTKTEPKEDPMDCKRCHQDPHYSKFKFAKVLTQAFNRAIPELDYVGTLRTFGYPVYVNLDYGLKENDNKKYVTYDKNGFSRAIRKILDADGVSPLAFTLDATAKDWYDHEGKIAVIVISDGVGMGEREVLAAEDLKAKYGEDVCIYTILIGNSPGGRKVMNKIALRGQCGLAVNGDFLMNKEKMEGFVRKIFLTRAQPERGCDDDNDGIANALDDCPGTKPGLKVDENGCWDLVLLADVLFDFDKYNLKPEGVKALEQVVALLNKYPFLDLHIGGHTDNYGSMAYNIKLSKRRAQAGLDYLVKRGIRPERISISWHSYSIPVATNDTAAGRALNRRLEFKFQKRQN